jgi:septal ring factor EnvC (AmiA/AmiB activator)
MKFITSNVNVILMSTIVLLAIFGIAYYNYQEVRFQEVALENAQYAARIEQLETNLTAQEDRLRRIFGELQEQLQDSVKFENLYGEITAERDGLEADIARLESDLQSEQSAKLAAERDRLDAERRIATLEQERDTLRVSLDQCFVDLDDCEANQC